MRLNPVVLHRGVRCCLTGNVGRASIYHMVVKARGAGKGTACWSAALDSCHLNLRPQVRIHEGQNQECAVESSTMRLIYNEQKVHSAHGSSI